MRTTLKHSLATVAALAALALSGTACTAGDDPLGNPAATQLLALGRVTIAGAQTAPADTRAISQDAAGFIGIRKTAFVEGDVLTLTLNDGKGGTDTQVTATLGNDGAWTLDTRTYYAAGTTLTATHAATPAAGTPAAVLTHSDVLTTDLAAPVELEADGKPLALTLVHANALLEVTPPAVDIAGTYTITLNTTPDGGSTEDLATIREEDAPGTIRYRTIALPGTVHSVTLTANNVAYTAPLNTPDGVKIEANKRYPIALTLTQDVLTATIATTGMNWGAGDTGTGNPAGYTRYIGTAEELARFAKDVNNDAQGTGARSAIVMQTADIDLIGISSWEPIGTRAYPFTGKYNGNGFSVSNLKKNYTTTTATDVAHLGLFGVVSDAHITGVHLRDCKIEASGGKSIYAGALVGLIVRTDKTDRDVIITLCSATGSITMSTTEYAYAGGMIGQIQSDRSEKTYITRCRANVAVTAAGTKGAAAGGFASYSRSTYYMGCIASGKVNNNSTIGLALASGFSWGDTDDENYSAYSCITTSELLNGNRVIPAFGKVQYLFSCLATQPVYSSFHAEKTIAGSNATLCTSPLTGASIVTPATAYACLAVSRTTNFKTLHWSKETGYTLDLVEAQWNTKDSWIDIPGDLPILDMAYEGEPKP